MARKARGPEWVSDVASIRLTDESDGVKFARFCGAIHVASRLGYEVRLRIVNDPYSEIPRPLDVYAEAWTANPPSPTP